MKSYTYTMSCHDSNVNVDELIRQETIACAETGILMAAWRDHCVRNLTAYEDLFISRLVIENEKYLKVYTMLY
jgi:hypothetical protein